MLHVAGRNQLDAEDYFHVGDSGGSGGVHAGNYQADGNPPEFPVVLDYFFNTATPIVPEDSNMPPSISLGSPANNATFTAPANITITAIAADSDGTISKVEFFAGARSLAPPRPARTASTGTMCLSATTPHRQGDRRRRGLQERATRVGGGEPECGRGPTVTGLALWLKADAGTTLNGATVSEWADQSGQGRMAVQPTAANQPALVPTELGKPALRFDGVNDFLAFNLPVNGLDGLTIFPWPTIAGISQARARPMPLSSGMKRLLGAQFIWVVPIPCQFPVRHDANGQSANF